METTSIRQAEDEGTAPARVHTDLTVGVAVIATVVVGNLLWHASDSGLLTALAGR